MKYLIYLLFIVLSFGQLGRISFFKQQVNIYPHEIIMGFILLSQIRQIGRIRRIDQIRPIGRSIVTFLAILFLSLINGFWQYNLLQNLVGLLYWGRLVLYFGFFVAIISWLNRKDEGHWERKKIIEKGLTIFVGLTVIFSYLQYFLYPNLRNLYYLGWDPHWFRVFGLFFDPTITGIIFVLLFFWLVGIKKTGLIGRMGQIGLIGLILLTYSRITYLSFIVGLAYYFRKQITLRSFLIVFLSLVVVILLLPRPFGESVRLERLFTIEARTEDYREGLSLFVKKPLLGYGYNRLRYARDQDALSHAGANFSSSFLTILVSTGIVGFLALLVLLVELYRRVNFLGKTSLILVSVASLFDNVLLVSFVLVVLLTVLALSTPLFGKKQ